MTMIGGSVWTLMTSWFTPTSLFLFVNLVILIILLTSRKTPVEPHHHHQQQQQHQLARVPSLLDRVRSFNLSPYKFEFDQPSTTHHFNQHVTTTTTTTESPAGGHEQHLYPDNQAPLARTPSLLDRLKSINLTSLYRSSEHEHPNPQTEILDSPERPDHETVLMKPQPNQSSESDHDHLVRRSKSDSGSGDTTSGQPEKMKKSASEREGLGRLIKEDEILERPVPATTRVEKWSDQSRVSETRSSGDEEGVDAKAADFINRFKQQLRLQRLDSLKRFSEMLKGKQC
ncbi:pathogen-associated molecular patterns-induced protein A70 [Ziziphus jujuba]|nr:pathogen-associated molecular patterns-induced protein A70 [Ziziphus jujuba]